MKKIHDPDEYERGSKWFADWHRSQDDQSAAIDIDILGYCRQCIMPLYVVEATRSRNRKESSVCERVGAMLAVPVWVVYQDKDGRHDGQILVDERNRRGNLGWLPEPEVWQMLQTLREEHRSGCIATLLAQDEAP